MLHRFLLIATVFQLINSQCDRWRQEGSDYSEESTIDPNERVIVSTKEEFGWEEPVSIAVKFINNELVPDLLGLPPRFKCHAWFSGLLSPVRVATEGELLKDDLIEPPVNMSWRYLPDTLYTVFLSTPDYKPANSDKWRQLHHWLVINVPDCDVNSGDTVLDYLKPQVVKKSGPVRYAFLVYQQPGKIPVPKIRRNGLNASFTLKQFVQKHKLENPKFGNFFFINFEPNVNVTKQVTNDSQSGA